MDVIYNAQNEYTHRRDGIVLNVKYRRPPLSSDVQRARRGHEAAVSIAGEVSAWSRRTCSRVEADCPGCTCCEVTLG